MLELDLAERGDGACDRPLCTLGMCVRHARWHQTLKLLVHELKLPAQPRCSGE